MPHWVNQDWPVLCQHTLDTWCGVRYNFPLILPTPRKSSLYSLSHAHYFAMRPPSIVCNVCKRILNTPIEEPPRFWPFADTPCHHNTLESFENAIAQGCNICSSLWRILEENLRNGWLSNRSTWRPILCPTVRYKGRGSGVIMVFVIFNGHVPFMKRYFLFPMDGTYLLFSFSSRGRSVG